MQSEADDTSAAQPHGITGTLTIDLGAIAANWRALESAAVPAEAAAVVKADAYGCGLVPVTRALAAAGCRTFFVATLDEAKAVRQAAGSAALYVLDGFFAEAGERYAECDARPVLGDLGELAEWDAFRQSSGWRGDAAIHIDTGMNRLGFLPGDAQALAPRLATPDHGIALVMSHLACAEHTHHGMNARQLTAFREVADAFAGVPASLANSSGIYLGPQFGFDLVRPGAALYGVNPTPDAANPMQAVVTLTARIIALRDIAKGDSVGYGATWTARRPTRLALVSAGYADGIFRAGSSSDGTRGAEAVVGGVRCPVAGRISMDLLALDVTDAPDAAVRRGQSVTLLGEDTGVDDLARASGTIGYEVLTNLGKRFARIYRGG